MPHIDLLTLPFFTGLSDDILAPIIAAMEPKVLPSNHWFNQLTQPHPSLIIVVFGTIMITNSAAANKQQETTQVLTAPLLLGVAAFLHLPLSPASLANFYSKTALQTFWLSPKEWQLLQDQVPHQADAFVKGLRFAQAHFPHWVWG